MDVILKVTKGAKIGTKIAVKKEEFLIGRSHDCHLCAGSTSISRHHCQIHRDANRVSIKDLGSRNGTLVNGTKIAGEVELVSGDTIAVGTLEFMVTFTAGFNNQKKPEVKSVADAVERTAAKSSVVNISEDISNWLLDSHEIKGATTDTQTIRLDDTKSSELRDAINEIQAASQSATEHTTEAEEAANPAKADDKTAGKKKEPGKLPFHSSQPATKDSREAAVEALRSWSRRR